MAASSDPCADESAHPIGLPVGCDDGSGSD